MKKIVAVNQFLDQNSQKVAEFNSHRHPGDKMFLSEELRKATVKGNPRPAYFLANGYGGPSALRWTEKLSADLSGEPVSERASVFILTDAEIFQWCYETDQISQVFKRCLPQEWPTTDPAIADRAKLMKLSRKSILYKPDSGTQEDFSEQTTGSKAPKDKMQLSTAISYSEQDFANEIDQLMIDNPSLDYTQAFDLAFLARTRVDPDFGKKMVDAMFPDGRSPKASDATVDVPAGATAARSDLKGTPARETHDMAGR